jgi:glycosyltransferase involved in cell wall biosynthesis
MSPSMELSVAIAVASDAQVCIRCNRDSRGSPVLRVLHVLEATLGGTRRILEEGVATMLDAPIVQGLVYGTSRADKDFFKLLERMRSAGWYLAPIDTMRRPMNLVDDALSIGHMRRAIVQFKPDVLHLRSAKAGGIGRVAAATFGKERPRIVYSPHALPAHLGSAFMLAERFLAPLADRFMADSESERHEIISKGIGRDDRVDVVYPAIDVEHYVNQDRATAREALGLPTGVPVVIGVGRLCFQKDPETFVATIARLRLRFPTVVGIWVGDGNLRSDTEAVAKDLRLGAAFRITGWVDDVRPYIAASDVLLSTSRYESLGLFVAEAFAMERPVVATNITGTMDVFCPAVKSFLYEPGNTAAAVDLVGRILDDPELGARLGKVGRQSMLSRFSYALMHTALCRSYGSALTK